MESQSRSKTTRQSGLFSKRKLAKIKKEEQAKEFKSKLQTFEELLDKVKSSIPVEVSSIERKMLKTKAKINVNELDKDISNDIDNLILELDTLLRKYQIYANGEYSTCIGRLKDIGLEVESIGRMDFQKEQSLELLVDSIKEVLDKGRSFVSEIIPVVEQTYNVIRALYDPNLPEESQIFVFAKQKLEEEAAPWIVIEAIFKSLNNWKKQYRADIYKSMKNLQDALISVASLSNQSEESLSVLGAGFSKLMEQARNAEKLRISIETKALKLMNVTVITEIIQSSLSIAKDVFSILYEELSSKEEAIKSLLPTKNYLWEKNITLGERMAYAMEIIFNPSKHELKQVMENLLKTLSYIDECTETIAMYNSREELLLNYPIAEMTIKNLFKQKKSVSIQDLPFETKYAGEYLRLFYSQRKREFVFDESTVLLMRREQA